MEHAAAQALTLGVSPAAVMAALERGPGRLAVVAGLLGCPVSVLERAVEQLRGAGLPADAALDWLVLSAR